MLRPTKALATLSPRFAAMYSEIGRPSIPQEQLLRAVLLQALYTMRSERLLMMRLADVRRGTVAGDKNYDMRRCVGCYAVSQRQRIRKLRDRGGERVVWMFTFAATAYNLVRQRTLGGPSVITTARRAPAALHA